MESSSIIVRQIELVQRIGEARTPGRGFVPLTHETRRRRDALAPGHRHFLEMLTGLAHWGEVGGVDVRGLVAVPSVRSVGARAGLGATATRGHLRALAQRGHVRWLRRPSRTRHGVLSIEDYPGRRPGSRVTRETPRVKRESAGSVSVSRPNAYKERARVFGEKKPQRYHGAASGARRAGGSHRKARGALLDLTPSSLQSRDRLDAVHFEAAARGWVPPGDYGRLRVATAAAHALRCGANPPALFVANLRGGRDHAAQIDEDAARALLREPSRPRPRQSASAPAGDPEEMRPVRSLTEMAQTLLADLRASERGAGS